MTDELEASLLLDLLSLIRRYGPTTIIGLSERLNQNGVEEGVVQLVEKLRNTEQILGAVSRHSRRLYEKSQIESVVRSFERADDKQVARCIREIYDGSLLPNKGEIVAFDRGNQINLCNQLTRDALAMALIGHLLKLPKDPRKQLLRRILQPSSNSLQSWASVILEVKRS